MASHCQLRDHRTFLYDSPFPSRTLPEPRRKQRVGVCFPREKAVWEQTGSAQEGACPSGRSAQGSGQAVPRLSEGTPRSHLIPTLRPDSSAAPEGTHTLYTRTHMHTLYTCACTHTTHAHIIPMHTHAHIIHMHTHAHTWRANDGHLPPVPGTQ